MLSVAVDLPPQFSEALMAASEKACPVPLQGVAASLHHFQSSITSRHHVRVLRSGDLGNQVCFAACVILTAVNAVSNGRQLPPPPQGLSWMLSSVSV